MPEEKKYITLDKLSRYNKLFKYEYWNDRNLSCDPVHCRPFYLQSQYIVYHNLSQEYPIQTASDEEGLPMVTLYDLPIERGTAGTNYRIRANVNHTYTLLLDNAVVSISLDPTPEYENIPDEPEGTEDDPFILYLGDAVDENDWCEFRVNDKFYIYFNNVMFVVYAGPYHGLSIAEDPSIIINLNETSFVIEDDRFELLPPGNQVHVSAVLISGENAVYQTGILLINEKNENETFGAYVDNRGEIDFRYINGNFEADFAKYQLDSSSTSTSDIHQLEIEAHYDCQNREVIIDNFYCDELPDNTWFEDSVSHVAVDFNIEVPDYNDYFTYQSMDGIYFSHTNTEDLEVGVKTDIFTFNYNGHRIWYDPFVNFITENGNIIIPHGLNNIYDLYSGTTSLVPHTQPRDGIVSDVIATPLLQEGYITEPKFTFNNHAFRFGREYNVEFLTQSPGNVRLDLLTGLEIYDLANALPSPLYVIYDDRDGYQLWYLNDRTKLTPHQPQIISKLNLGMAVDMYCEVDDDNYVLNFYYNPLDIMPTRLDYQSNCASMPIIWYADGNMHPYTIIVQDPNNPNETFERGMVILTNATETSLTFAFTGPNGIIYFDTELQDGDAHSTIDWDSYKFPYASSGDDESGYAIHYELCPEPEDIRDNFPPESWPTHKTLNRDWDFMNELHDTYYSIIGVGGACVLNDSNQIINMWGDITFYVHDDPKF